MGAAAAVPAVLSIASLGLQAGGSIVSAGGNAAADTYQSELMQRNAEYGELKATQTTAQLTRNLTTTLGNIDAVRAAAKTNPTSPTGVAGRDFTEQVGTEQKNIQMDSIMAAGTGGRGQCRLHAAGVIDCA